jgi:hypothetical protein
MTHELPKTFKFLRAECKAAKAAGDLVRYRQVAECVQEVASFFKELAEWGDCLEDLADRMDQLEGTEPPPGTLQ